jgi:hypothetical protein
MVAALTVFISRRLACMVPFDPLRGCVLKYPDVLRINARHNGDKTSDD